MGVTQMFLCILLGCFVAVQSVIKEQDDPFFHNFPGFFDNLMPFERNFDFPPYDTIFSSWRTHNPEFHMLAELPSIMSFPRLRVFCDESKLTVLVDKRSNGIELNVEEMQLGDGCYSNGERPNQFVFNYNVNECGTIHAVQNGLTTFTNTLHMKLKKTLPAWRQIPFTMHISCTPINSYNSGFFAMVPSQNDESYNIKAMNPSWTSAAESSVYRRGDVINFQVSAKTRHDQQLFIQSCFVSASPEPQTKPRHAVIMNKGCTALSGSLHPVVQFVASNRRDVVNFVVNTTYLISEMYIHCSVLISNQGVTSGSKSCNYNVIESRWEDISGDVEVCECCLSKCKGPSVRYLSEDAKATVSTGPLVFVDKVPEKNSVISEPQESTTSPVTNWMSTDAAVMESTIVSGASLSRGRFASPKSVVVVSQDPVARLTLWLPGQEQNKNVISEFGDDRWLIPSQPDKMSLTEEPQTLKRFGRSGMMDADAPQVVNDHNRLDFNQVEDKLAEMMQADAAVMPQEEMNDARPVIRSKLQFVKGKDGSQTLSYEEEVVKRRGGNDGIDPRQKGLQSAFLDLLRRLNKAE